MQNSPLKIFSFLVMTIFTTSAASASWLFGRQSTAKTAKFYLVGFSKEKILECMGAPTAKANAGGTEVWTYRSGGDVDHFGAISKVVRSNTAIYGGKQGHRYCNVNVAMKKNKVVKVGYSGHTGGLISGDEQCAYAVQSCLPD